MRWADIDQLGHVNNVRYVDYADEARLAMVDAGEIPAGQHVTGCEVRFILPLMLSSHPVRVSSTFDGGLLQQEIYTDHEGQRVVYAQVKTHLATSWSAIERHEAGPTTRPYSLRRTDTYADLVSNASFFELLQESRIVAVSEVIGGISPGGFVVGTVTVDYAGAVPWRAAPYEVSTWLERYGRSSLVLRSQVDDGDQVVAAGSAVLVGFDMDSQRSRPFNEAERKQFESALSAY